MVNNHLADQGSRDAAIHNPNASMILIAGAGTGKTHTMVGRLMESIRSGQEVEKIVAITFTVKAAHELKERLIQHLSTSDEDYAIEALKKVPEMRIGTIDSITRKFLADNSFEANLLGGFKTISDAELDDRFSLWFDANVEKWRNDETLQEAWEMISLIEVKSKTLSELLRKIARKSIDQRQKSIVIGMSEEEMILMMAEIQGLINDIGALIMNCPDNLIVKATENFQSLQQSIECYTASGNVIPFQLSKMGNAGGAAAAPLKNAITSAISKTNFVAHAKVAPLFQKVCDDAHEFSQNLLKQGILTHTLALFKAIEVLENNEQVRLRTQSDISSIMVDEFQDTSPDQIKFIELLQGENTPLFVVGDPKQSIYGFRGADLVGFFNYAKIAREKGVAKASLTSNFRSHSNVLNTVNAALAAEFGGNEEFNYEPLNPATTIPEGFVSRTCIVGTAAQNADETRLNEADLVLKSVLKAMKEGWKVRDKEETKEIKFSDIVVLYKSRSALKELIPKLEATEIPYRIEGKTKFLDSFEIRAITSVLRLASTDPETEKELHAIAKVGAIRSLSLCGTISDLEDKERLPQLEAELNKAKIGVEELSPFLAVCWIIQHFQLELIAAAKSRPRSVLNRLRAFQDRALAAESAGIFNLKEFISVLDQESEGIDESPSPEQDESAIRLMTVHNAKGLEFPMVIAVGFASQRPFSENVLLYDENKIGVKLKGESAELQPVGFQEVFDTKKSAEVEEVKRTLYVAITRAKDHLVMSSNHKNTKEPGLVQRIFARKLEIEGNETAENELLATQIQIYPHKPEPFVFKDTSQIRENWTKTEQELNRTTPTRLAHSVDPEDETEDFDLFSSVLEEADHRLSSKKSTHFGLAVHLAMQKVDFSDPKSEVASKSAVAIYDVDVARVEQFVKRALDTDPVKAAATSSAVFREVYAATIRENVKNQLLEGIVDLVYTLDNDTLGVVDYKTDRVSNQTEAQQKFNDHYRNQGLAYKVLLEGSTGKTVSKVSFIFLALDPPCVCEI